MPRISVSRKQLAFGGEVAERCSAGCHVLLAGFCGRKFNVDVGQKDTSRFWANERAGAFGRITLPLTRYSLVLDCTYEVARYV